MFIEECSSSKDVILMFQGDNKGSWDNTLMLIDKCLSPWDVILLFKGDY